MRKGSEWQHIAHVGSANLKTPGSYWPVYVICLGVWLSGAIWLLYHYYFPLQTSFGVAPNPMEHWSLVVHGGLAFASLWLMGYLWGTHVTTRWRLRRHRKTGGTLFAAMALLIGSGYLLYYLSSDEWRAFLAIAHWFIGLGLPLVLLAHWLIRGR